MMRTLLVALATTVLTTSAIAADLKAPPPPPPPFSWTGFYVGVHTGSGWADHDGDFRCESLTGVVCPSSIFDPFHHKLKGSGFVGGGHVGVNWQFMPSLVLGVEGDISWTSIDDDASLLLANGRTLFVSREFKWLASVRGRLGFTWDQFMIYATGGGAWARVDIDAALFPPVSPSTVLPPIFSVSHGDTRSGWVAGGGVEWAPGGGNWSTRVEFLHYQFDNFDRDNTFLLTGTTWRARHHSDDLNVNVIRFGASYKFGAPAAPVAARY
jgi:outer membrane immunogenic protein